MKFNAATGKHELEFQDVHDEDVIDWLRGTLALDEEDPLILFPENIQHIIRAVDAQSGKKMGEFPELLNAIKRGRSKGIGVITNALYENAKNGNVVAQIFFLKNRAPAEWKDRQHIEETIKQERSVDPKTLEQVTEDVLTRLRSAH